MRYNIKTTATTDWNAAETACISNYVWDDSYKPEAYAGLLYIPDRGLAVRMCCRESNPRTVYTEFYDPVYRDSCLEFFFSVEKNGRYVNCEMNSAGAALIAAGDSRNNRIRIDEIILPPKIKTGSRDGVWWVETLFTLDDLARIFGEIKLSEDIVLYGNFYKCGDDCEIPHHGMWSPVGAAEPDFHRPEYFGELVIV
ncbi:MAG: carbohydrate-binding family 9-like protein [Eubacteriales bacterium]|jgi:hypothetical protein|nr:carbohydrate-binding family 9-like protein [Eubacteriales bacterium]